MKRTRLFFIVATIVLLVAAGLAFEVVTTQPVRGAMRTCSAIFTIANRPDLTDTERLDAARSLCSTRYLQAHPLVLAAEGGLSGFPRNINKNFKAWREGSNVWICPTNRIGPVYQFVFENGDWRFDGPVAILRPWGEIVRTQDIANAVGE
jgi:predicted amidohydrolase